MFTLKRNQIIITALVVMLAVAGYLNLQENKLVKDDNKVVIDDSDIAASGTDMVEGDIGINTGSIEEVGLTNEDGNELSDDTGKAVFVSGSEDDSYFVQAKLDREQARSKRKDVLMDMIENKNVAQEQKSISADELLKIQEIIEKENAAEAMIEAKGFSDVYVRMDEKTVDVIVNKESLTEAEIAQIEDIVKRKTGYESSQIRISPLKNAE